MKTVYLDYYIYNKKINKELKGNEIKTYLCLEDHRNNKHTYAFPSQDTIAEEIGISVSSVKRAIKKLVEKEYIETRKQKRKILGNYNIYELKYIPKFDKPVKEFNNEIELEEAEQVVKTNNTIALIEGKTGLELSKWQKFVTKKMDGTLLLQTIGNYIIKNGRTFTFLISLYTDLLSKKNLFTKELAKLFKVTWTGNNEDYIKRQEEIENRDVYDDILYSIYTPEEVQALKMA